VGKPVKGRTGATVPSELEPESLRRRSDPARLGFSSTEDVTPARGTIGQPRANDAIGFGLQIDTPGYNVFATGPIGTGKRTALEARVREHAATRAGGDDWVYLHNFGDARRPLALALPGGRGRELAADMERFLEDARRELARAFEGESYVDRRRAATEALEREREPGRDELRKFALSRILYLARVLEDARRERARACAGASYVVRRRAASEALEREVALFAIGHLIDDLKDRYGDSPRLAEWLDAVSKDVTENVGQFRASEQERGGGLPPPLAAAVQAGMEEALVRYEVNALVSREDREGAPVVVESNPTYLNLFGRIEHRGVLGGGFTTDHRMLRPGAVHRANGGYLILPAAEVLAQPLLWLKLKDVLRTSRIRLENPADQFGLFPTTTLTPEPVELDLKVVLVGRSALYELAYSLDEDVRKLFRVKADFDLRIPWDGDGEGAYAGFLSAHVRDAGLRHFDAGAVARVVEHGARLAENSGWLSTRFGEIAGLAAEASHWANVEGSEIVGAGHVELAIERAIHRSNLLEQHLLDMVAEGALLIDFDGERVGQANGLSIIALGDYSFGRPVRITATVGAGRDSLVSIDRETELSGPVHNKGFLILGGFLRERYGGERRIALSANIAFEQSYAEIEGDSAASAELYALLSALADVPIRQGVAVTGSVDQHGRLQAIGGVNEKVEGFHRACALEGLTGRQGVLIPESNVRHLMLSPEVVESVRAGRFHVWSAASVDAGIELLTGVPAGARGEDGAYPEGSIHALVEARLERLARAAERERGEGRASDGASGRE
jgi:predicted ATP-dependent protease